MEVCRLGRKGYGVDLCTLVSHTYVVGKLGEYGGGGLHTYYIHTGFGT